MQIPRLVGAEARRLLCRKAAPLDSPPGTDRRSGEELGFSLHGS